MSLRDHINVEYDGNVAAFARRADLKVQTAHRYCVGRVPSPDHMKKIIKATGAKVTANDWFEDEIRDARRLTPDPAGQRGAGPDAHREIGMSLEKSARRTPP